MDERRGLQCVMRALLTKMMTSQPPEFIVDQRQDGLERLTVPIPPLEQYLADLLGGSWAHFALRARPKRGDIAGENTEKPCKVQQLAENTRVRRARFCGRQKAKSRSAS